MLLGKPQKQIFGKSCEFGPTGLTPAPFHVRWDSQKGKQIMFKKGAKYAIKNSDL